MKLPYPAFTWSITQHFGRATARNVYGMVHAAYLFGKDPQYSALINQYLLENEVFTENIRSDSGLSDTWRDYQQILNELGLIVSTRFTDGVEVTQTGLAFLDGIFGYSELVTTQCYKYQYPNGYKLDIQVAQRKALSENRNKIPSSRTELDAINGVQVKPAILILRLMLELLKNGYEAFITDRECVAYLFPVRRNSEWRMAFDSLTRNRGNSEPESDTRMLRHAKEWFSFLSLTDNFVVENQRRTLSLSDIALNNIDTLSELCDYHERPDTFWVPISTVKNELAVSWFQYFGSLDIESQWFIPEPSEEYVARNYIAGVEYEEDVRFGDASNRNVKFNLQPYEPTIPQFKSDTSPVDISKIKQGQVRREESARLHEMIVARLATVLRERGYTLLEDRSSVDLLAQKDTETAIIEVKTVTKRNLNNRLRLGVGQLSEYRYRHQFQTKNRPTGVLVLGGKAQFADWLLNYFQDDVQIGLVSVAEQENFQVHTKGKFEQQLK